MRIEALNPNTFIQSCIQGPGTIPITLNKPEGIITCQVKDIKCQRFLRKSNNFIVCRIFGNTDKR